MNGIGIKKPILATFFFLWSFLLLLIRIEAQEIPNHEEKQHPFIVEESQIPKTFEIVDNVTIKNYFDFLDSIITDFNSQSNYRLTEHILVRYNPWIIDTLANTDYYKMMERDSFVYDQKQLHVLKKGQILKFPNSNSTKQLQKALETTWLDINIPEFKLRIYQDSILLYGFPVRVGQNKSRYLAVGNRITNLRTVHGHGKIVRHVKNPSYYNPVNKKRYFLTKRDDGKTTKMPQIPSLETEINQIRNGQMIHPTTNPITLGKAYSNGCIGTKESDAWIIYYHAPVGTTVRIRYDLNVIDEQGNSMLLKDIYNYSQ